MDPKATVILHETKKLMPSANHRHGDTIPFCQNHNPMDFQDDKRPETGNKNAKTSQKLNCNTPDWLRSEAAGNFSLLAGHDCPAKHMYHKDLFSDPFCTHCNQQD